MADEPDNRLARIVEASLELERIRAGIVEIRALLAE